MYDAAASSRSAVPAARLSIASEPCRPFSRTDEAAEWRALPVSSIPRSNLLAADRPNSSTESPPLLPHSAAVFFDVLKIVMMLLHGPRMILPCSNSKHIARRPPLPTKKRRSTVSCVPGADFPIAGAKDTKILHWGQQFLPPRRPSDGRGRYLLGWRNHWRRNLE